MGISRNDPFDLRLCMRGLSVLVTYMHSDIYEYVFHFTFKKSLKSYAAEFKDPWEQHLEDDEFFRDTDDPLVINCLETMDKLIDYKLELNVIFGIDELEDLESEAIILESSRFQPYLLFYKHSKSYKKLKSYYERSILGFIESLSLYAYALTAQSYKIPLVLRRQLKLPGQESLRLLNHDDSHVEMIKKLIIALQKDVDDFRHLCLSKAARQKLERNQ